MTGPAGARATGLLFREDAYLRTCRARVISAGPAGIVLDATVFYPRGGGQPGDTGRLESGDGTVTVVADAVHGEGGLVVHVPAAGTPLPAPGAEVTAGIDWPRRYAHMRMHTCLHLLGSVLRYPVTGGNVDALRSRLDFDMPESPDRDSVTAELNALIARDLAVGSYWVTEEVLDARPELVRTLSVSPPRGAGRIRLVEVPGVDLQPCGGTHVRRTGEIGKVQVSRIDKKGRLNRRVYLEFAPES